MAPLFQVEASSAAAAPLAAVDASPPPAVEAAPLPQPWEDCQSAQAPPFAVDAVAAGVAALQSPPFAVAAAGVVELHSDAMALRGLTPRALIGNTFYQVRLVQGLQSSDPTVTGYKVPPRTDHWALATNVNTSGDAAPPTLSQRSATMLCRTRALVRLGQEKLNKLNTAHAIIQTRDLILAV